MATRLLNANELAEVQPVFGAGLKLARVRIDEASPIPNWIGVAGAWLKRKEAPAANAVTFGDTSYFPRALTADVADLGWLMHELTHQWQYQRTGIRYVLEAMFAPTYAYANLGETPSQALTRLWSEGKTFAQFNREQQGDIVRDYYFALKTGPADALAAWAPYLEDLRKQAG